MAHVCVHGVADDEHLHHGHDEDDGPHPGVPEDLDELLDEHAEEAFKHGRVPPQSRRFLKVRKASRSISVAKATMSRHSGQSSGMPAPLR